MSEDSKIKDTAEAVKGIVQAVPVYEDLLQPATREIGKGLETIAKAVHVALAPIAGLVWGYDTIKEFVFTRVAEKLRSVPPERIRMPQPNVVGPALEALRFTGHDETLRELYANLLATSLDADTAENAHPSFVEMIKSMSPDEARIMRLFSTNSIFPAIDVCAYQEDGSTFQTRVHNFSRIGADAGCDHPSLTPSYLDNLGRLGLLLLPGQTGSENAELAESSAYEPLEQAAGLAPIIEEIARSGRGMKFHRTLVSITALGRQFCTACVIDKNRVSPSE